MKTQILKEFIQHVWNEGNVEAISEYLADTYTVFHDPGDPWEGKVLDLSGFQNRVAVSRAPVPDQCFDIQESYENEDSVCIIWLWSGTHKGDIAGFPASGKTLKMSGATVYHFKNGKICGHWQIADRMGIYQQLQSHHGDSA